MILGTARKKGHRLSRLAVLPDHIHAVMGCEVTESPEDVALSYLNNLAFGHGMQARYCFSYYVGTFGEYDLDAVRRVARGS